MSAIKPATWAKRAWAAAQAASGGDALLWAAQRALWSPFVRAVNYHGVAAGDADGLAAQLALFAARFVPVDRAVLDAHLAGRRIDRDGDPRPGLILSFDDGLRSHHAIAAPLLER